MPSDDTVAFLRSLTVQDRARRLDSITWGRPDADAVIHNVYARMVLPCECLPCLLARDSEVAP